MTEEIHNVDCMVAMADLPDDFADLAIVDPPYGIHKPPGKMTGFMKRHGLINKKAHVWDVRPEPGYFRELFRVSRNQIIWGAQYFLADLPDTRGMVVWDKKTGNNAYADGELAYVSHGTTLRIWRHQWCGVFKDSERGEKAEVPTQKPVALYKWLLQNYAKPGDLILDTHLGSGASYIAAIDLGFRFMGFEIDPDTYQIAKRRAYHYTRQTTLTL